MYYVRELDSNFFVEKNMDILIIVEFSVLKKVIVLSIYAWPEK